MEPLALPIRARFVPLRGPPDCSPDWSMPHPGRPGSPPFCSRWAAGWSPSGVIMPQGFPVSCTASKLGAEPLSCDLL